MPEFAQVLALALLPALGNFAGGLLAEKLDVSRRRLNQALHAAAGVVLAVVAVELIPEALDGAPAWLVALAFVAGGLASILIKAAIGAWHSKREGAQAGAWVIYIAVCIDLFSDGLMIGAGSVVSFSLAIVLALGQVTADIPEGFATIATFKERGLPRKRRMLLALSFVIPILLGAGIGYFGFKGQNEEAKLAALAFTGGLLFVAAIEDMLAEAHEATEDSRASVAALVGGFGLFMLAASYLH